MALPNYYNRSAGWRIARRPKSDQWYILADIDRGERGVKFLCAGPFANRAAAVTELRGLFGIMPHNAR